jgi:Domain of unknown function (DUF4412)
MKPIRLVGIALLCCAVASPALADVTLKSKRSGTGMVGAAAGDMTQYIKGLKTRTDQTSGAGKETTTIVDLAAKQLIVLNHDAKEADVIDMTSLSESLAKAGATDITASITPTTQTRQIAGQTCTVYDLRIAVPIQTARTQMKMVMSGPQCLVKNGPGQAEFLAFYRAASENGGFLDPAQAKTRPAAAKAMTDMYRKMAELGVPFATEMKIGMEAEGPMAEMMKKMDNTITTEVTSISTAPIAAAMFDVPAGYKVSKR